ncbi:Sec7-domain-containing protein [Multifurca ochricompacta]|uniref:Sec7-domain-containing protein n=1 Tax=Multifurca ochricompacta TaxID=376703 RepID=A0AAD4LZD0_9AGAM|nr:Sec7-domain-containing protein [Multifurca ochricompacta]
MNHPNPTTWARRSHPPSPRGGKRPLTFPHHHNSSPPRQLPPSTVVLHAISEPRVWVLMDSDRSSRLAQDVEIPTSMHSNISDTETPGIIYDSATTNGHVSTGLKNDLEDFIPDAIKIEPSFEESEERAEEDSATQSAESDDGEGLQDVPLGNSKVNATGAVNEHAAPSDHIPDHDSSEQQPKPAVPTALSATNSEFQRVLPDVPPSPPSPPLPEKTTIHSVPSASPRESLPRLQPNGAHSVVSPSLSTNSLPSASSPSGAAHRRSLTIPKGNPVSSVLITSALETIAASREAKKSAPLRECAHRALELVRADLAGDQPHEIFEPLRLACETRSEKLMIASLDCITKLISHSFFIDDSSPHLASLPSPPPSPGPGRRDSNSSIPEPSLVDLVVHTITSCHTETSPDAVSLQVVRALLALVLSSTILVHQSSLLKAVRTVYNVFLMSNDPVNQTVAQGSLTQMVNQVFARCKIGLPYGNTDHEGVTFVGTSTNSSRRASIAPSTPDSVPASSLPLDDNAAGTPASRNSSEGETLATSASQEERSEQGSPGYKSPEALEAPPPHSGSPEHEGLHLNGSTNHGPLTTKDLFIKDAFLVFRAMCKLTMKPLNTESERDLKSHAMRSKLLSLHMVLIILSSHMDVFVSSTSIIYSSSSHEANSFIQMANQYLCLCLSRNAVSPVPQVFEISVEIFWRTLSGLRTKLKKEIEVLFHEIFIPILEMKTSTLKQKSVILSMISRLCQDPQAIVDIYINYDCDSQATDNIYEHLVNVITKLSSSTYSGVAGQKNVEPAGTAPPPPAKPQNMSLAPSLSTTALGNPSAVDPTTLGQSEAQLRRQGLECLVSVLRSLVAWGTGKCAPSEDSGNNAATPDASVSLDRLPLPDVARGPTPDIADDPSRFESAKQKKTTLMEGIKRFNQKPKKGIQFLVETGFIQSQGPQDVARFLLNTEGLSKAMIGEYLGEGDEVNVATMHAFVDMIDLRNTGFVDALRAFLQAFRLPGEAQKIDRFMLKFAERYIEGNTQTPFANADAAYVLSYSTIMLNTDAHNPQVKHRMTKNDFIKNNRGVNDSADLPEEFLSNIYDDIVSNEIRMKDEMDAVLGQIPATGPGLAGALVTVGRDLQREAYMLQSSGMADKTEALFKTMTRTQRKGSKIGEQFYSASHFVHVRPMFEVAWIPVLAGISGPLQRTDDMEVVELCLDGFKNAIRIVCFFDLELERNAFVTTLAKFTFLNNLGEMKAKNMEAIKTLLDVAVTEGNNLKGSWHEVLSCVSQLEHMQLISSGVDVPDSRKGRIRKLPNEELANESRSTHITVAADMVFSLSHYLSGIAIVDFVRALCDVSWEEIQSSGLSQHPRLFSLQKLVEISYYNMNRIRLEWSNLWDILGEHFNQVCCHSNPHVGFFALDSLRQLAMRFLEKEELPHFKFQKDFLRPFEYTMTHNANPEIRDMVLQCLQQMIQARVQNMRSGWRTMFGVFSAASKSTERIPTSAFEIVTRLNKEHFSAIVRYGAFADLTVCITDFCKVSKYQKISLLAIAMLRGVIPVMLNTAECGLSVAGPQNIGVEDPMIRYWFPVLFGFYDIIMNGEDLEVRRLALDSLFNTLKKHGSSFPVEFWDTVCQELLFPIFAVLKSSQDLSRFSTQEDMSVWLSTTMIQALRDLIDLYTFYFDILERFLDGLLDLLCVCICQENDTLARIGTSCLQQLLESNVKKLSAARWERVAMTFVKLFRTTMPHQLFDESLRVEIDSDGDGQTILPAPLSPTHNDNQKVSAKTTLNDRRRIFKQIIVKCVLQLLLIETTNDLLRNDDVYRTIPPEHLLRLMGMLDHSYQFARMFNEDKELRTGLWKVGFMKHLPNLLKQESSSAATLVHILLRMYYDPRPEHQAARPQVAERLLPLGLGVLQDYSKLKADTQAKNIAAWTPVVAEILHGFCKFDDKAFSRYLPAIYPLVTELLTRDTSQDIRDGLREYFLRVGYAQGIVEPS